MFLNPYDLPFNRSVIKQQTVDRVKKMNILHNMSYGVELDIPTYFILRTEHTNDLPEFKLPYVGNDFIITDLRNASKAKFTTLQDAVTGPFAINLYPTICLAERMKYKTFVHKDKVYLTLPILLADSLGQTLSLDIVEKTKLHTITMLFMASNYGDMDENIALLVKKYSVGIYSNIDLTEVDTLVSELSFDGTIDSYIEAIKTISDTRRMQGVDTNVILKAISTQVNRGEVLHVLSSLFIPELLLGVISIYADSPYLRRSGLHRLLKNNKRYINITNIDIDINKLIGW